MITAYGQATVLFLAVLTHCNAFAHPGNGIAVDSDGQVFFFPEYTGKTIYKIDTCGNVALWPDDQRTDSNDHAHG